MTASAASGAPDLPAWSNVDWEIEEFFRDGRVVRFAVYTSRADAMRSVGIRAA